MDIQHKEPADHEPGVKYQREFGVKEGEGQDKFLTTWTDMTAAGLPPESVKKAYGNSFDGQLPDKVHINDTFCINYDKLSYNIAQPFIVHKKKPVVLSKVADTRILENDLDEAIKVDITLSTSVTNSATVTVSQTTTFQFSDSATISVSPDIFNISDTFSELFTISNKVGSSSTQSIKTEISDTASITVPPHSKINVNLEVTWLNLTEDWEMPVEIQGWTGAEFPNRVRGHYYWFYEHASLFPTRVPIKSSMKGTVGVAYDSKGTLKVEPASMI